MTRFENSLEHLLAEAKRIDMMLRREIVKTRERRGEANWDEFRGLYISEDEMDKLLASPMPTCVITETASPGNTEISRLTQSLGLLEADIGQRRPNSLRDGIELRLEHLKQAFNLNPFEVDCLLIGLLPELDLKYQRLYAYLQDDVTKKSPTVDMTFTLLASSPDRKPTGRAMFLPDGNLLKHQLITLNDPSPARAGALLEKSLKVEQRVVDFLLGSDQIDARLSSFVGVIQPAVSLSDVLLPDDLKTRLHNVLKTEGFPQSGILFFHGPCGSGKRMTAEALCHVMKAPLLTIDLAGMLTTDLSADLASVLISREACLQKACLYWDCFELLLTGERDTEVHRRSILEGMMSCPQTVFVGSQLTWDPATGQSEKSLLKFEFPVPSHSIRRQLWQINLNGLISLASDVDLDALANKFRFTGGQIKDAAATANNLARARGEDKQITMNDIYQASRAQSNQKLNALARKIQPKFTWEDIVLPRDQMSQLRETTHYVQYRHIVFGEWNFDRKVSLGKGLNILFAGPSGTGKTMAAEIMAGELKLDLYKIDLSTVVSKYIGETEKNLDRIFREAQDSNSILFFDEADAIFGKRSEVRDSHDRYANIEIAYLLQRMEEYDGIVILATNMRKNLDEAFARRMQFCIEFPLPEEGDRYRIWRQIFPKEAPVAGNVDLNFMSRQFKITGGNIKNIALGAAFLAASDGRMITIAHLIRATKREYQKIGRLCTEADFAQHFDLVKG